jgi:cell division protein FtsB
MAFWFYLAVAAYVYICVSTLQIHIPMGSVLGLLGISATTGLAAVAVDSRKHLSAKSQKAALLAEQAALNSRVKDLSSTPPAPGSAAEKELIDTKKRLAHVDALVAQQSIAIPAPASNGFFQDILSDGDGVSFHRFQIAVWTLVLGSVFVWGVYRNLTMPEFDASLLTLMGISAGTYVGFKFPETPKT